MNVGGLETDPAAALWTKMGVPATFQVVLTPPIAIAGAMLVTIQNLMPLTRSPRVQSARRSIV